MANIAPTFTPRYVCKYRAGGRTHDFLTRGARGESQAATVTRSQTFINAFFTALASKLPDDLSFISATYYPQDSNVGVPVGRPVAVVGLVALGDFTVAQKIAATRFSGKTSGGSKANYNVFSLSFRVGDAADADGVDYTLATNEDTAIDNAMAAIFSNNMPGIDGTTIVPYAQATIKQHDHYVKRVRKGT